MRAPHPRNHCPAVRLPGGFIASSRAFHTKGQWAELPNCPRLKKRKAASAFALAAALSLGVFGSPAVLLCVKNFCEVPGSRITGGCINIVRAGKCIPRGRKPAIYGDFGG